jgi:hypothetical protein
MLWRRLTRPKFACFLLAATQGALGLRALDVSEWKNRQILNVDQSGIIKLALPPATLDAARSRLEDLRLVDSAGHEIPFTVEFPSSAGPPPPFQPKAFRVRLAETTTQVTIETGTAAPLEAVALLTGESGFIKSAEVEVSADGEHWESLALGVPVFRQRGIEQLRLDLQGRRASQIRVTLDDRRSTPIPWVGARLFPAAPKLPAPVPLAARLVRREEFAGESVITLDLGAQHVPLAALEFATGEPLFTRQVTIGVRELHGDNPVERTLAEGSIWRVEAEGLLTSARLDVPLGVTAPLHELLVHVANGDSPPLTFDRVTLTQYPVWLIFRAAAPGAYSLLTGNHRTAIARYDLASLGSLLSSAPAGALEPGPIELNPAYRPVETLADTPLLGSPIELAPWSDHKPVVLAAGGVQELELEPDVLAEAKRDYADLRLTRDGSQIPYLLEHTTLSRPLNLAVLSVGDPQRRSISRWQLKLPSAGLPLNRLTLTSATPLFERHLRIYEKVLDSRGEAYAHELALADWNHTPEDRHPLVFNSIDRPSTDTLFLETENGDNPPLTLDSVQAAYPVVRLLFKTDPGPLSLYYGNPSAPRPRYDLDLVADQIIAAEKNVAKLGPSEKSRATGWAAGALAGLRGGPLFWGALSLVVIALLIVVAKLLPKPPTPNE